VGYTSKEGIGRKEGYGTLAAFYYRTKKETAIVPYVDLRLHIMDDKRLAGNVGLGFQKTDCDASTMLRGYAFFDYRNTRYRLYKQISIGAEWSGPYFNLNANGYLPLNQSGQKKITDFRFRHLFLLEQIDNDYSFRGFDFNASRYIYCSPWFRMYVSPGVYYYYGRRESIYGGKFRFEVELYQSLVLSVQTSYDRLFHTRTCAAITLTLPVQEVPDLYRTVPVRREEIVVVKKKSSLKVVDRR